MIYSRNSIVKLFKRVESSKSYKNRKICLSVANSWLRLTWLCFVIQCLITERTRMVAALLLSDIFLLALSLKLEFPWLWAAKYSIFIFIGFKFPKPGHPSGYWSLPWPRQRQIQRWSSWIWKQVSLWGQFKLKQHFLNNQWWAKQNTH